MRSREGSSGGLRGTVARGWPAAGAAVGAAKPQPDHGQAKSASASERVAVWVCRAWLHGSIEQPHMVTAHVGQSASDYLHARILKRP